MKFLTKNPNSQILADKLVYKIGNSKNNNKLKAALLKEQKNFCAYTEIYISQSDNGAYLESLDVDHFDASKKNTLVDDYYNYYTVSHKTNIQKLDERFKNASFHKSLFFHIRENLDARIYYDVATNTYKTIKNNDTEAEELIEFIRIDSEEVAHSREKHLDFLEEMKTDRGQTDEEFIEWLFKFPQQLNFITAIEAKFNIDLESRLP